MPCLRKNSPVQLWAILSISFLIDRLFFCAFPKHRAVRWVWARKDKSWGLRFTLREFSKRQKL